MSNDNSFLSRIGRGRTGLGRRGLMRAGGIGGSAALLAAATGGTARATDQPSVNAKYADFLLPKINSSDDSLEKIKKKGVVTVGIGVGDWPYSFIDDKTKAWTGIDAEIITMINDMLEIPKVNVETVTFDGVIPGTLSGRFDLVGDSIHYTKNRAKVAAFCFPTYYYAETLVVPAGNPLKLHKLSDCKGHKVGTNVGTNYMEWLGEIPGVQAVPYKDWNQMLPELAIGRIDAVLYDQPVMAATMKDHPEWKVEMVEDYDPRTFKNPNGYSRYAFRQGDVQLVSAYSAAIEWMQYNGEIKKILSKWGLSGYNN